ncbi:hypothetical protein [Porphyromonas sp.]|uniref:hypothetical protein n=1 Tax=Porphyromonas sp. TaxID=1924944 RepID=UPI0026DD6AE6|nr:hypothetical protein [Porphyromonas sp.]MDO4695876.1 hypothetical protein [Porphyromonas sp.]MDO4771473.1 hypothetical protein [Porphyromonas sp.]
MNKLFVHLTLLMVTLSACDHGDKPELPKSEKPIIPIEKPAEPVVPIQDPEPYTFTAEDLAWYYGWDNGMTLDAVETLVNTVRGAKKIGDRTIEIKEAVLSERDAEEGTFTLDIRDAEVDGKKYSQTLRFTGFSVRPSDSVIGMRAYARWKVSDADLFKDFDLDPLYVYSDVSLYNTEYLSRFVSFFSSDMKGKKYTLTEEDLKYVKIEGVKYEPSTQHLVFKIRYKGFSSTTPASLPLKLSQYYGHKVSVDEHFTSGKYMRGVYQYLSFYFGYLLKYDTDKYAAELVKDNNRDKEDNVNKISLAFTLTHKSTQKELAIINKEIKGFKPLSELQNDLALAPTYELNEYFRERLKGVSEGRDFTDRFKHNISVWIMKARFVYKDQDVDFVEGTPNVIALQNGVSQKEADLYLEDPRFELVSAVIREGKLSVKVRMYAANDVAIEGVTFDFVAHI